MKKYRIKYDRKSPQPFTSTNDDHIATLRQILSGKGFKPFWLPKLKFTAKGRRVQTKEIREEKAPRDQQITLKPTSRSGKDTEAGNGISTVKGVHFEQDQSH